MVIKCHNRCHNQRVAGMNANRINIFHTANCNCVVVRVTHYLKLNFFITLNTLFNKHLMYGRKFKCIKTYFYKFFFIVGKTAACTAQSKSRTKYYRVTYSIGSFLCFFNAVCDFRRNNRLAY